MSRAAPPVRDGLRMAFGTLTAVPVPPPRAVDRRVAGVAMTLAPLAALFLAALAVPAVLLGTWLGLPPLVSAVAAIGVVTFGSRGLHLDGLADTADGLAASYDRDRALDVMRRGDVGPTGVVTLVLAVLTQVAALAGIVASGPTPATAVSAMAIAVVAGRGMLPLCCVRGLPSARPEGLGAAVAGSVPPGVAAVVAALVIAAAAVVTAVVPGPPWWQGVLAVLLGWLAAGALLGHAVRRFGGVTGDVLGACVETATLVTLVVFSASGLDPLR
ncbi:adenosylcobinamide-GDP ribazoletransferase [Saccharomonospora viridis]|jgi:adenosylcobinamide-GDP ribazoletransferase|uniref:Adenosylcobinamide-GDP ribazoletransferase n=2 Tax=Saccharomonospora viridis TaxID=1852 RepID=C7MXA3_SACVD|nr:adenosylcobinamide-GDP ribazoletransferase [Saccharomonospora viridis]ACU95912.1 cobalamin-5-phosphate synthase [Saccharomonospora viridis DSM 43017]KHF45594.1 cobalamin synthase [Saccharomonospora viridis]SFP73333.1 cobalamin-5'-phosphate synthase [Saccharomonospora viridis]